MKTKSKDDKQKYPGKGKKITRGKGKCSCTEKSLKSQRPESIVVRMKGSGGESRTVKQK